MIAASSRALELGAYRPRAKWASLILTAALLAACEREPAVLGDARYATLQLPAQCAADPLPGEVGAIDALQTPSGAGFSVRTPRNYDPTRAHPLLVVLAPAGHDRHRSERHASLTTSATAAGFVVAYADHVKLTMAAFPQLGEIPGAVAERWCIDASRVSFVGHSDGGSSAAAVAFMNASTIPPAAVVVSATGLREDDLRQYSCAPGVDAMIVHSRADTRFPLPEFGRKPAQWWARCNRCSPQPGPADTDGCVEFTDCAAGVRVRYCEVTTMHEQWPGLENRIVRFANEARR